VRKKERCNKRLPECDRIPSLVPDPGKEGVSPKILKNLVGLPIWYLEGDCRYRVGNRERLNVVPSKEGMKQNMRRRGESDMKDGRGQGWLLLFSLMTMMFVISHPFSERATAQETNSRRNLIAIIPENLPPTYFKDERTNRAAGFAVDVMDVVAQRAGYTITYRFGRDWEEVVAAVKNGQADIAPDMGITGERKKILAFTIPTEVVPVAVFVRADSAIADLRGGIAMGVIRGSAAYENIRRRYPHIDLRVRESLHNALFDLLAGQIDALCCPVPILMQLASNAGLEDKIKIIGQPVMEMKRAIALRQDDRKLLEDLNRVIPAFVDSPEYERTYVKWYGKPKPWWTVERMFLFVAGAVALVVVLMALWRHFSILRLNKELLATIEERKKTEAALKESEENFRALFDKSADAIIIVDTAGRITGANDVALERYKYSRDEFLHMHISQIDAPDDAIHVPERMKGIKQRGIAVFEAQHMTRDGIIIPTEVNSRLITRGGAMLFLSTCRDISERKRAEEALAAEKDQLAITLRSIGDGVIATDIKGNIATINPAAADLTGWTVEEARGRPLADVFNIINERTRERCVNPVEQVLRTGCTAGQVDRTALVRRDGREIIIAESAAPIQDRQGKTNGIVLVFRDRTAELRVAREMQKLEKLESLGLLAGGLAHDFNNLLTSIVGNVGLAKMYIGVEHKAHARLTEAEKATQRAADLAQQLLTFAKGGAPIKKAASVPDIAREACRFALSGSSVNSVFSIPPALWCSEVDRGQINQVFGNLIINSVHAMPDGGTVHIGFENISVKAQEVPPLRSGDYVKIAVRDEGSGIPEEHLPRIFDPYFTTKPKGNGLGLATALSIMKRHDGHIAVESKEGVGTTVTLYLPAVRDTVAPEREEAGKPEPGHGRVLVMDDEDLVRSVAGEILITLGYEVGYAKDGNEAIAAYQQALEDRRPFDIVIMDLTVPGGMGGREAVRRLHAIAPGAKVVVSSGYSLDPIMAEYRHYGFCGVIEKPYSAHQVSETIGAVLNESGRNIVQHS
jgi:PAS domain S-box-containing protein